MTEILLSSIFTFPFSQVLVNDSCESPVSKYCRSRMVFPVELFPDPVLPRRTILSSVKVDTVNQINKNIKNK